MMCLPISHQLLNEIALELSDDVLLLGIEGLDIPHKYLDTDNGMYETALKCLNIWKHKSPDHTTEVLLEKVKKSITNGILDHDNDLLELFNSNQGSDQTDGMYTHYTDNRE